MLNVTFRRYVRAGLAPRVLLARYMRFQETGSLIFLTRPPTHPAPGVVILVRVVVKCAAGSCTIPEVLNDLATTIL